MTHVIHTHTSYKEYIKQSKKSNTKNQIQKNKYKKTNTPIIIIIIHNNIFILFFKKKLYNIILCIDSNSTWKATVGRVSLGWNVPNKITDWAKAYLNAFPKWGHLSPVSLYLLFLFLLRLFIDCVNSCKVIALINPLNQPVSGLRAGKNLLLLLLLFVLLLLLVIAYYCYCCYYYYYCCCYCCYCCSSSSSSSNSKNLH